uniref:Uncharacterized protein n=1 Tax=Octopus bimaculoides TaxID=37653 RepID=A0A0L8G3T0_OCTBM
MTIKTRMLINILRTTYKNTENNKKKNFNNYNITKITIIIRARTKCFFFY